MKKIPFILNIMYFFIPQRESAKAEPEGVHLSILYFNQLVRWKVLQMPISTSEDSAKQIPKEVQLFLLMSYFLYGNVYWTFNLHAVFCLFETLKMFYCAGCSSKLPYIRVFLKKHTKIWWDGSDGWDGISFVSFNFLHTLWVYR